MFKRIARFILRKEIKDLEEAFSKAIETISELRTELDDSQGEIKNLNNLCNQLQANRKRLIRVLNGNKHSTKNREFFRWLANRLEHVYKESPNTDFVQSLRDRANDIDEIENEPYFECSL